MTQLNNSKNFIKKNRHLIILGIALLAFPSSILFTACGPKEYTPGTIINTTDIYPSPSPTPTSEFSYLLLKEDFIKKGKNMFTTLPYHGYVKIIKEGNSLRFIYMNEIASEKEVEIKLHQQSIIMDLDNKNNSPLGARPLANNDPEYVDINTKKINIIFSGKCNAEYLSEISTDMDKYSAYEYFKITKEGYNIEILYGGKEYNQLTSLTEEKYYRSTYRLGLDRCDRQVLTSAEKVAKPFGNPSPSPTATPPASHNP